MHVRLASAQLYLWNMLEGAKINSEPSCVGKLYEYFQCPIRFDQEKVRLVLPLDVVDEPLPGHTDELASCSGRTPRSTRC